MPVVVDFNGRIDSKKQWDFDRSAVNAVNGQRHLLLRLQFRIESIQIETFFAGKPKRLRAMLCCELQRQYAHADRFERWMRSKLRAMTALTPNNCVPLAAQSRDEPVPYSSPANTRVDTPSWR